MPVVNPNAVAFSAATRVFVKPHGGPDTAYVELGLLGQNAQLVVEETVREKRDFFPEVPVAVAVQAQSARLEFTVREWRSENVAFAFGAAPTDVTTTTGTEGTVESLGIGGARPVKYYTLKLEELMTNGQTRRVVLHKVRLGIRGGLSFASVEEGGDIPMVANAVYDPAAGKLLTIETITPSP